MRVCLSLLLIFCFMTFSVQASEYDDKAQASDFYKNLEIARKKDGIIGVNKVIEASGIWSNAEIDSLSVWAKDAYLRESYMSRYGLLYAEILGVMTSGLKDNNPKAYDLLMDTGTFAYFSSYLSARENVARCDDNSASSGLKHWYATGALKKKYKNFFNSMSKTQKKEALAQILSYSGGRDLKYLDKLICSSGMQPMSRAMEAGKCKKVGDSNNYACSTDEFVEFISDKDWADKRKKIKEGFIQYLVSKK